ncbi:pancreatic secretory granule membrane major glycoprotein GP2-like [Hoplias malabaricus]|uniref:pancreatic secretory granule membrane major glycoprotein GP2-like n=1 Tax=Hoplias malabaricus TaxID=27720 RepID=UPI0034633089
MGSLLYLAALLFLSGAAKAQNDSCAALQCTDSEVCSSVNGVYGCGCTTRPNPDIFNATLTCLSTSGSLSLSRCELFEAGFDVSILHLNNPNCTGTVQNGLVVFEYDIDQNPCGTYVQENSTSIVYKNSVQIAGYSGIISRHNWLNINFTCVLPIDQEVSDPIGLQASSGAVFKDLEDQATYQISMLAYPNNSFITPFSGGDVLGVNTTVFVAVAVSGVDEQQIATVLDHCFATPTIDSSSTLSWDLIVNDCPNPKDGTVKVLKNGVSTTAQFSFTMFTFTSVSSEIYLHCEVHLCLKNKGNCVQDCKAGARRRRRSLNLDKAAFVSIAF